MELEEKIVSVEIAKLLPDHGFDVMTEKCWGTCPSYNGKPLDLDDEMELRDEGVADEDVVDMDVLYDSWWHPVENYGCLPAPTHGLLNDWLIEKWGVCIIIVPYITTEGVMWCYEIKRLRNDMIESVAKKAGFEGRGECFEAAVAKVLNEVIE